MEVRSVEDLRTPGDSRNPMCGIAGLLATRGRSPDRDALDRMSRAIAHRGPDGHEVLIDGPIGFGHRRLSILDTSPAGAQPMTSADGRYTLIHNGEIYNFLELADELRREGVLFKTKTDSEVILEAFSRWGPESIERFNGIWAFAVWDRQEQALHLSRDRLGVKPLFLATGDGMLAFSSEIKALLELPWVDRTPEPRMVRDFLLDGHIDHTEHTFFRGIRRLPAAGYARAAGRELRVRRYWQPAGLSDDSSMRPARSDVARIDELRALVVDSISLQLRSDVAVGTCLSGGLDSSSIVTIADALRRGTISVPARTHVERDQHPQLAFFAAFAEAGIDERRYVDAVVERTGVGLRTTTPTANDFLDNLEDVVRQQDEPFGSSSIYAQYEVMRLARSSGVKVMLDGQGPDELLGGYPPNRSVRYGGALRSRDAFAATLGLLRGRIGSPLHRVLWFAASNGALPPTIARRSRVLNPWLGRAVERADRIDIGDDPKGTPLARTLWRDIRATHLPGLLRFEDRNSMRFGIESRVPFLDHRIVELCLRLPDRLKITDRVQKVALRKAFGDLVPAAVVNRMDKIGFETPEEAWIHAVGARLEAAFTRSSAEREGLLKPGTLAWIFPGWRAGKVPRDVLWRVISLELWHRIVVSGDRGVLLGTRDR